MYQRSKPLIVVNLILIIGVISVTCGIYCRESQEIPTIVGISQWDSILFKEINRATDLGNLTELRKVRLQDGDIEVRIWRAGAPLEGVSIERIDGLWSGVHIKVNRYDEPESAKVEKLESPKSGWEFFWKKLVDKGIVSLPHTPENECDTSYLDGTSYVVEINQDKTYRNYYYHRGDGTCRESKQMEEIAEIIGLEFDSGQEECKTTEWFPCMTLRKSRNELSQ